MIDNYFQYIQAVILSSSIVDLCDINYQKREDCVGFLRGNIYFKDGSYLHVREFIDVEFGRDRGKYSYQYMDKSNQLIFRYDNARHHQKLNLPNYPHHKHDGSEDNIIPSNAPTLEDILKEIEQRLI